MKKLFISCPMKDRTDDAIVRDMERMHKVAEIIFDQELEVIPSFIKGAYSCEIDGANTSIYFLGEAIKKLAEADYFIGVEGLTTSRGCDIEARVAFKYDIPSAFVDAKEFMPDVWEKEREGMRVTGRYHYR